MKQVTRNIDPEAAHDLLERPARACLAFAQTDGPLNEPVVLLWRDQRYQVGIPESAPSMPSDGQEVVLLVDEGIYFYDLRAIYIRGHARPMDAPAGMKSGVIWFEIIPDKTVAWDYGTLHEAADER